MSITERTLQLQRGLARQLEQITDRQTRVLVSAWVDAWDEVAPDLTHTLLEMLTAGDRVTRAQLMRSERLRRALGLIADQLEDLAAQAGVLITGDLRAVIDMAGSAQASVVDSQLPPAFMRAADLEVWSRVDPGQVATIVRRSTEQITSLTQPLGADAYDVVRRELIRGVAAGSNPRETARRMVRRAEGGFNGGLTRALVIARTETLDAHREAARLAQAQHADTLTGWRWLADLGPRTCPACLARHGQTFDLTVPGPDGHQNCRCGRIPVTRSWADLGFTGIEEPPDLFPDAHVWFEAQPKETQLAIMGPARLELLRSGEVEWADLATLRHTSGWRDSWAPTPVKTLTRRAAA